MSGVFYYTWLLLTLILDLFEVYGVDIAAGAILLVALFLWAAARGWRRNKRLAPVLGWLAASCISLAVGALALYQHFQPMHFQ